MMIILLRLKFFYGELFWPQFSKPHQDFKQNYSNNQLTWQLLNLTKNLNFKNVAKLNCVKKKVSYNEAVPINFTKIMKRNENATYLLTSG